jgi:ankyrin repeat protein
MTELISKAADGDWTAVKKLLAAGANPTLPDHQGLMALDHAALLGYLKVVSTLLADTEPRFRLQSRLFSGAVSCLHLASQEGHLEVVKVLIKAGGEALLYNTSVGCSCLHLASRMGI